MTQKIQLKVYNECYNFLKPGQCLIVQDFAKNRDIVYQDEIKANYLGKETNHYASYCLVLQA